MSLNWVSLDARGVIVPLPNETETTRVEKVDLSLTIPQPAPSDSNANRTLKELKENGTLFLTNQRIYFISAKGRSASFQSFSVPLVSLLSTSYIQPVFGANYIALNVKPVPNGGLNPGTRAEIRFSTPGLAEFAAVIEKSREKAMYNLRDEIMGEALPIYASPDDVPDSTVRMDDLPPPPSVDDGHHHAQAPGGGSDLPPAYS